jgi:peptidoglycan/xylan/chitin deacetylase (PgdA/CDA1 family)
MEENIMRANRFFALLLVTLLVLWPAAAYCESESCHPCESCVKKEKLIALTFDDGPGPLTGALLDALSERGAKATFFLFGKNITEETAPMLLRMRDEGHCIGSHTYSHARLTELSDENISIELKRNDEVIKKITGEAPVLVRPPFGSFNDRTVSACGKPVILWSLDTRDWELDEVGPVLRNILNVVCDGDVVLMHDQKENTIKATIAAIDVLKKEGYRFVTVPELFAARNMELLAGQCYHGATKPPEDTGNK